MPNRKKSASASSLCCALIGAALLGLIAVPASAWYDKTHVFIMVRAMKLLEAMDKQRTSPLYDELYRLETMKILAKGVSDEDYLPDVKGNSRSFWHYYDPDAPEGRKGVPFYRHYYAWIPLEGASVVPPASGYYDGTMELVRSINIGNPLNWPGAIHAYNYTEGSRKEAFSRLGRIVHLLGDMADVDHAVNMPHAGSGKVLPDTLEQIAGPAIIKRIEAKVDDPSQRTALMIMVSYAYSVLKNGLLGRDPLNKLIGYEGLVEDFVSFDLVRDVFPQGDLKRIIPSITPNTPIPPIGGAQPVKFDMIEPYFDTLARKSKVAAKECELKPAIGCLDLARYLESGAWQVSPRVLGPVTTLYYEPIYVIPNIKLNDPSDRDRYLSMAWSVIRDAVEFNAGLMEFFMDIVNQPPYVRKIIIEQDNGPGRYSAEWEDSLAARTVKGVVKGEEGKDLVDPEYPVVKRRELVRGKNAAFESGKSSDILVTFGPEVGEVREKIDPGKVFVSVGRTVVSGRMIDDNTWKGSFVPEMAGGEEDQPLKIQIEAADLHGHYPRPGQGLPDYGYALDSDPSTPAAAHYLPPYPVNGYELGADSSHAIVIKSGEEKREARAEAAPAEDDYDARIKKLRELVHQARAQYFVWINRPSTGGGRIHVGDQHAFNAEWRYKDERFFGLSSELLAKIRLAGPFETEAEAYKAVCGMIGEITYTNVPGWGPHPGTMYEGVFHWVDAGIDTHCPKKKR